MQEYTLDNQEKMDTGNTDHFIKQLADLFGSLPQVKAVGMGGSRVKQRVKVDPTSDVDLYVFTTEEIPLDARREIVEKTGSASRAELGLDFWGPNDTWYQLQTGMEVDNNFFEAAWMEDQIDRVLVRHQPGLGYTTCFWHTIRNMVILSDPHSWLKTLQTRCMIEYPEPLRRNIINFNHKVLRSVIPAYAHQLEKAAKRGDIVSVNHRLAGLLASYFDIIFALNRQTHPGEKRLLELAAASCPLLPVDFDIDVRAVLGCAAERIEDLDQQVDLLLNHLDDLLLREGILE